MKTSFLFKSKEDLYIQSVNLANDKGISKIIEDSRSIGEALTPFNAYSAELQKHFAAKMLSEFRAAEINIKHERTLFLNFLVMAFVTALVGSWFYGYVTFLYFALYAVVCFFILFQSTTAWMQAYHEKYFVGLCEVVISSRVYYDIAYLNGIHQEKYSKFCSADGISPLFPFSTFPNWLLMSSSNNVNEFSPNMLGCVYKRFNLLVFTLSYLSSVLENYDSIYEGVSQLMTKKAKRS